MLEKLRSDLKAISSPEKAKASSWFFKTGPGQYGEGDQFLGVTVPEMRVVAKKYKDLSFDEIEDLLHSPIHEERLISLFILVNRFKKAKEEERKEIVDFYLANTKFINNWDLVDSSAGYILGTYLLDKPRDILYKLAKSENLWEKRIGIISTQAFINAGESDDTIKITEILMRNKHDLIHKAVGWMLREVGKRVNETVLISFLDKHASFMPRTMLRYAIEKLSSEKRSYYMRLKLH